MTIHRDFNAAADRLADEKLISVSKAAKFVPAERGRRGYASAETLVRWIIDGKRGVFLDGLRGGGKSWWTSREAISRFMAELTRLDIQRKQRPAADRSDEPNLEAIKAFELSVARRKAASACSSF